jgi:hypothetical protein
MDPPEHQRDSKREHHQPAGRESQLAPGMNAGENAPSTMTRPAR